MLEIVLPIPFWLEMAAVLTGGLSGAMSAVKARFDIFGVTCIAIITGLAGGILRDVLLQDYGIYAFQNPSLLVACAVSGVIVFYFGKLATYLDPLVDLLDNLSVALWAVISVGKGLSAGLGIIPSIILGTITAVGGGILRDICMNREPEAFQAGTLYGSAALIGSIVFALMEQSQLLVPFAPWVCAALVLFLRYASLLLDWRTKPPHDYSDVVTKAVARPMRSVARRVHPPKGKVERDREKTAYKRLRRIWRAPGSTSPLPPATEKLSTIENTLESCNTVSDSSRTNPIDATNNVNAASGALRTTDTSQDFKTTGLECPSPQADPSDHVILDRTEFNRIKGSGKNVHNPFES